MDRWVATSSTFGLQPMWARRLMQSLDATLEPSARSGDGYFRCCGPVGEGVFFRRPVGESVSRVDCRRWFSGRLVLLGDAAHAMPPNLGQGANSALVDGVVLAEELASAPSVKDALVGYDKRRRPLARRVQRQPRCSSVCVASNGSRLCARGTLCWWDWPGSRG